MYTVYKHVLNNKVYIGITSQKPESRWLYGWGYKECPRFYNAIQKYGWNSIQHEILFTGLTKEEAEQKEVELIAFYHSTDPACGYNIDNGGNAKGKCSDEHKRLVSEKLKGVNNPFYGRKHSINSRMKISANHADVSGGKHPKAKAVMCVETGIVYGCVSEASIATNTVQSCISRCCLGERKSAGGLHWKYADVQNV